MIGAEAEVDIEASPEEILRWVLDLQRYRRADTKITRVLETATLGSDGVGRVRYRGRLRGIPTPADTNVVRLSRWDGLTFEGAPDVWTRRIVDFTGTFRCTPGADGTTTLVHTEAFEFHPAFVDRLAGRVLRRWLQDQIELEVLRLKVLIESPGDPGPGAHATRSTQADS